MQRCSIGVEMWRCRCRGPDVQRCRGAEMQRCAEVQRSAEWLREEMQMRCSIGVEMWRCRVQRYRVQGAGCRVQKCSDLSQKLP